MKALVDLMSHKEREIVRLTKELEYLREATRLLHEEEYRLGSVNESLDLASELCSVFAEGEA